MGKFKKNLNYHNSGCTQDRVVMFGSRVGFSGTAYLTASSKFTPMATKFGTKTAITRLI